MDKLPKINLKIHIDKITTNICFVKVILLEHNSDEVIDI